MEENFQILGVFVEFQGKCNLVYMHIVSDSDV